MKLTLTGLNSVSETPIVNLADAFPIGKPIKVRIISVDAEQRRIVASVRQAISSAAAPVDIDAVEIGHTVSGVIMEVHKDNAVLTLHPSGVRALVSLMNLSNARSTSVAQIRVGLKQGEELKDLVVVSRSPEKALVIVACRPRGSAIQHKGSVTWETVQEGQLAGGRVVGYTRHGARVKLGSKVTGTLHPTDCADDYESGTQFPAVDSIIRAMVIAVDKENRQLVLSTRPSRVQPGDDVVVADREIHGVEELKVGETVRGFIKSIAEHGLFIAVGRTVDARVQIKELFEEVYYILLIISGIC
jgi:rRNA biogenesis protein RRP5